MLDIADIAAVDDVCVAADLLHDAVFIDDIPQAFLKCLSNAGVVIGVAPQNLDLVFIFRDHDLFDRGPLPDAQRVCIFHFINRSEAPASERFFDFPIPKQAHILSLRFQCSNKSLQDPADDDRYIVPSAFFQRGVHQLLRTFLRRG